MYNLFLEFTNMCNHSWGFENSHFRRVVICSSKTHTLTHEVSIVLLFYKEAELKHMKEILQVRK